jgi:hypothetical protein
MPEIKFNVVPLPSNSNYAQRARIAVQELAKHKYQKALEIELDPEIKDVTVLQLALTRQARHDTYGKMAGKTQREGNKLLFWMVPAEELSSKR